MARVHRRCSPGGAQASPVLRARGCGGACTRPSSDARETLMFAAAKGGWRGGGQRARPPRSLRSLIRSVFFGRAQRADNIRDPHPRLLPQPQSIARGAAPPSPVQPSASRRGTSGCVPRRRLGQSPCAPLQRRRNAPTPGTTRALHAPQSVQNTFPSPMDSSSPPPPSPASLSTAAMASCDGRSARLETWQNVSE